MKEEFLSALKRPFSHLLAVVMIFFLVFSIASTGQTKTDSQNPLQYEVNVVLKLVQVYVTGKGGNPVSDLTDGEFEVLDNGQPVAISHFEKHFLGGPESVPGAPGASPRTNRKFFLLFDFAFIDTRGILKAKNAGLHFLDTKVQPDDEVGVITYTAFRGLVLHEYLTRDHAKVRQIVDGFGLRKATGRAENLSDYVYTLDLEEERSQPGQILSTEEQLFREQAKAQLQVVDSGARQSYVDRARRFVMTLANLAKSFRYIPGYKNIILFSGGVARQVLYGKQAGAFFGQWSTPEQLAQELAKYDDAQPDSGLQADFTKMLVELKASNSPVYALDVSRSLKEVDAAFDGGANKNVREFEGADSLRQFASGTGGRFYANTMDYRNAMDNIQNVTGAYYVLGYSVSEKWDGKFHKIKVKVKRKGCDVLAQGGYFSPKPFKEYTSIERLLQVTDLALSEVPLLQVPEEIPVAAMAVTLKGWPQLLVVGRASRAAQADVLGKTTEVYLIVTNEKGDITSINRFRPAGPDIDKDVFFPTFLLATKPGRVTCRMVLRNLETGRGARGQASLIMPENTGAGIVLDPPLLLTPDSKSLDLASSQTFSLSKLYSYDTNSYAPVIGDIPAGTAKLFAALRCTVGGGSPDLDISASFKEDAAPSPAAVPVNVLKKTQEGSTSLIFIELAPPELKTGRYSLTILVKDKNGPAATSAAVDFAVK